MSSLSLYLVVLRSADTEKSITFYNRIGLKFKAHQHGAGEPHFASEVKQGVFEIYPSSKEYPITRGTRIGFTVKSIDAILKEFAGSPSSICMPPKDSKWGRRAVLLDPDGHKVELLEK